MYQPRTTYRIQFNASFTFKDLENILPYLDDLGIKTIYASPIFDAMPGSMHGYDGLNPNLINPEIGTYQELQSIALQLKSRNMGWIQDFVPNHMTYSIHNGWLCDFMEKGKMSAYDCYFDKNPDEPLMAPFLSTSLLEALDQETIHLLYDNDRIILQYADQKFPLNYTAYFDIINHETFDVLDLQPLRTVLEKISQITDKDIFGNEWAAFKDSLRGTFSEGQIRSRFHKGLKKLSRNKAFLLKMLDVQFYRLCQWTETNERINYRRFFTINSLICMNMQRTEVFEDYHKLLHQLVDADIIQGVRIDHVDGLYDPKSYLKDLRELLGDHVYIVVEKILEHDESLPAGWPVQGTSGYDFLAKVNQVLIRQKAAAGFDHYYHEIADKTDATQLIYNYKEQFLREYMKGEWNNLFTQFKAIFEENLHGEITDTSLKNVIAEILVCCPVYRYYPDALPLDADSQHSFDNLISIIRKRNKAYEKTLQFFVDSFTKDLKDYTEEQTERLLHFWRRCMQLSGPLMAKGVEDTLIYNYPRFLALNEVGSDPGAFGIAVPAFHKWMTERTKSHPLSMSATATHDTKRGEDSRSRLQYLSIDEQEWLQLLRNNTGISGKGNDLSTEDKIFILQVVYSSIEWDDFATGSYHTRLSDFLIKSAREAKKHSNWHQPDEVYENKLIEYAFSLLETNNPTGTAIRKYLSKNKRPIIEHSLAQLILKCTCPGVPDIYQGTELWDLHFVDPDNRQAVDYEHRKTLLKTVRNADATIASFLKDITDPAIKLFVLHRLLQLRKEKTDLFDKGTYEPIKTDGNCIAFSRQSAGEYIIVILPLEKGDKNSLDISLPENITGSCKNIFTGKTVDVGNLQSIELLSEFPFLVLASEAVKNDRKSGILLPLFSLSSTFGIGGMGSEAYSFLDFLSTAKQSIWQLLPLNPVLKENAFSPYACTSAFAGDFMYIDPVLLMEDGLLEEAGVRTMKIDSKRKVSYSRVKKGKAAILAKAWKRFKDLNADDPEFTAFCEDEGSWLNDFALFTILKEKYNGKPWFEWPKPFRDRNERALSEIQSLEKERLSFQKWIQFIFLKQWKQIKEVATKLNISLLGDVPFYLAHDSSDVWANRNLFKLDDKGLMLQSAGVPPDYFSKTGQLWSMPTYHWEEAAKNDFEWWIRRLKHNSKLFDIVRLDHFRAFFDYWEVPASHEDAVNGSWKKGPQDALFEIIQKHFPDMPFLAEDLGEIHPGVFKFIDKYQLPGMRVLQFGFDPYNEKLRDVPHNFKKHSVVYTGTHDNNTIMGWYHSLSKHSRKTLNDYTGIKVNKKNVHKVMVKMALASIASWSIILAQDLLGLDETCRINTPSTAQQNWKWRLMPHELSDEEALKLAGWTQRYNRC